MQEAVEQEPRWQGQEYLSTGHVWAMQEVPAGQPLPRPRGTHVGLDTKQGGHRLDRVSRGREERRTARRQEDPSGLVGRVKFREPVKGFSTWTLKCFRRR